MWTTLIAVAVLHWLALLTPGANVLLVSQLAAAGDRRAAGFAALGISSVALVWSMLAVFGVHAVFAAHPSLRLGLQVAGAAYLGYVALRLWRAPATSAGGVRSRMAPWLAFRLGFLTNLTNPKSALFYGSVFATALPAQPATALLVAVVALVVVNALIWHLFLALAFSHPKISAAYDRQRGLLNRVAGALIGAIGLRLLVSALSEARSRT